MTETRDRARTSRAATERTARRACASIIIKTQAVVTPTTRRAATATAATAATAANGRNAGRGRTLCGDPLHGTAAPFLDDVESVV